MNIDRGLFQKILDAVGVKELTPADAELVVSVALLAVAADRREDPDERALFDQLAEHVYATAKIVTTPPTLGYLAKDDDEEAEQRLEQLRTNAMQLDRRPAGALSYALAYILTIADCDVAHDEMESVDVLRDALGLDEDTADDLVATVSEIITPMDE
jgi:hypothetical protein